MLGMLCISRSSCSHYFYSLFLSFFLLLLVYFLGRYLSS